MTLGYRGAGHTGKDAKTRGDQGETSMAVVIPADQAVFWYSYSAVVESTWTPHLPGHRSGHRPHALTGALYDFPIPNEPEHP